MIIFCLARFIKEWDNGLEDLETLEEWSKKFWKINPQEAPVIFAQRGYEDKGCGHINRILANVEDLLDKYGSVLYRLNFPDEKKNGTKSKEDFITEFYQDLESHLILFYVSTHLHDIGMRFPGIFKALSDLTAGGASHALHIGRIIHDYHHYSSFIVLLELYNFCKPSNQKSHGEKTSDKTENLCPYLSLIKQATQEQNSIELLPDLFKYLENIYNCSTIKSFFKEKEEFFVTLAILCLLHKEVDPDYVQSILRKYKTEHHRQTILRYFNKCWNSLNIAEAWTKSILKEIPEINNLYKTFSGNNEFILREQNGNRILNLFFVEALLQYGDKTEITIDRLVREHEWEQENGENSSNSKIPLQRFIEDSEYDNRKGFICTDISQRIISSFARFRACRFIPLALVEVQELVADNNGKLAIIFHYLKFPNDQDVFRIIRYHNEKDFYDLGFLDIIKIHIPVILSHYQYRENPIMDIVFKKREHQLLSLEDMQEKLLANLKRILRETQKNEEEVQHYTPGMVDTRIQLADFLKTKSLRQILKQAIEENSTSNNLMKNIEVKLKQQLFSFLDTHFKKIPLDYHTGNSEKKEEVLPKEMEQLLPKWLNFIKKKDLIKEKDIGNIPPVHLMNTFYIQLRIGFIYFLESEEDETGENYYIFADDNNDFLKLLDQNKEIRKGINHLREAIYKESITWVNPKNHFPYTPHNTEAIREFSASILDPGKRKKTESAKKVFYETSDLVVPTCFETIAILNLFNEEG